MNTILFIIIGVVALNVINIVIIWHDYIGCICSARISIVRVGAAHADVAIAGLFALVCGNLLVCDLSLHSRAIEKEGCDSICLYGQ